jgi:hypothetical protein
VRSNADKQFKKLPQPILFGDAELFHINKAIGSADDGTNSDKENINEQMIALISFARVGQLCKTIGKAWQFGAHRLRVLSKKSPRIMPAFIPCKVFSCFFFPGICSGQSALMYSGEPIHFDNRVNERL